MNVAIIDDDIAFIEVFKKLLEKNLSNYFEIFKIEIIYDDFYNKLKQQDFDIIFIDIDLKGTIGINLVSNLKQELLKSIIIFVSSRNDLVFDALSVQPFQFIRKANLEKDLLLTLLLLNNYFKEHSMLVTLESRNKLIHLKIRDIIYIESDVHEISIVTFKESHSYRSTLKNILNLINSSYLIQIQKSIVINFDHIKEVNNSYEVILDNGNIFSINRFYKKKFIEMYKEYLKK